MKLVTSKLQQANKFLNHEKPKSIHTSGQTIPSKSVENDVEIT